MKETNYKLPQEFKIILIKFSSSALEHPIPFDSTRTERNMRKIRKMQLFRRGVFFLVCSD